MKTEHQRASLRHALVLVMISSMPILGTLLIAPVLPSMLRHFAAVSGSAFLVPFVQTAPALALALIGMSAGGFAERFGRKRLLLASISLYVVAAPAPLVLDSLYAIIASRLVVGVAEAGLMTTATTLISDYFTGKERDRYLGLQVLASSVSAVAFITIGGVLGTQGWRTPFLVYLAPIALIPVAAAMLWEPASAQPVQPHAATRPAKLPWRRLLPILAVTLVAGMCMNLMSVELGFVMDELGERRTDVIGLVAALNSAGIVGGSFVYGWINRMAGSKLALSVSLLLAAAGYAALSFASGIAAVTAGGVITGVGCGFYLPWLLSEANRVLDFSQRGRGNGLWLSSYFLSVVAGPPIATGLAAMLGSLQAAMLPFALLLGLAAPAAILLLEGRRKDHQPDLA